MNTPFTHQQVKDLPIEFTSSGEFPNRRTRRVRQYPRSTKYHPHSNARRRGRYSN